MSVVVGAVLAAVFPTRGARPRGRRPLLGFVSGVLAVLVVASASWVWAVGRSVWHTTAAAVDPGPVPSTVHEVAWTWEPPRGVELWNVLPTASGAVAVLDDGVIGLDTATGEERWHYRRPGTGVAANVTPDGKTVVLTFRITDYRLLGDGNRREALLALDAATGRVLGDGLVPPESPPLGASWTDAESWPDLYVGGLTADALITWPGTEELRSLGALDLRTGEMRWTADTDPDCRIPSGRTIWWLRTLPDTVLLPQLCSENGGETARITAFDADSGEHRWVHEQPVPGQRGYRWLVVAGHHAPFGHPRGAGRGNGERPNSPVVVVAWDGDSGHLVLDSATGEVLADGADHATGCGGLAHYTAETVAVLCPGEVEQTLRLEKRTLDGDAVAGVEIPTRLGFDTLGAEPLSTAEVDWLSLAGAGVAVWGYQTPDGQSRLEAYVAEWDGDVRTIALPDTGRSWTRLRSVPGAVLAYANESREVVGLR
ncbi:outer membrane protein assembly factor BamB [Thermobifida halotolerans]|uniref:PQQ-binding-like beta-propeller repeat protein n=1 Tax=Thermobifida halotolerans TaxID=483545 RepID=UPI003513A6E2